MLHQHAYQQPQQQIQAHQSGTSIDIRTKHKSSNFNYTKKNNRTHTHQLYHVAQEHQCIGCLRWTALLEHPSNLGKVGKPQQFWCLGTVREGMIDLVHQHAHNFGDHTCA